MRKQNGTARHRRRRTALAVGVPLALAASAALAHGSAFGLFGTEATPKTQAAASGWAEDTAEDLSDLLKSQAGPQSSLGSGTSTGTSTSAGSGAATVAPRAADRTVTVAKDGSGQYKSVQQAVDAIPAGNTEQVLIRIAPGTYRELVKVPSTKPHLTFEGTGSSRGDTTITYDNAAGTPKPGGSGNYGTSGSATVAVEADDFTARNLTFANDFDEAGNQHIEDQQAVALRTAADRVRLDGIVARGDQDTLLLDTAAKDRIGRVYVTDSLVEGNVDFVFGRAGAVIDRSVLRLKKRWNGTSAGYVTAPSTPAGRKGFLVTRSAVDGDVSDGTFHLGRPWHAGGDASLDPQTTVRESELSAAVKDAPWTDMGGFSWKDDRFAEYRNTGAGSGPAGEDRPHLTDAQAAEQEIADWLGDWKPAA